MDFVDGEMVLSELYPGVTVEQVKAACGWDLKVAARLRTSDSPSDEVLALLRNRLDPEGLYLK